MPDDVYALVTEPDSDRTATDFDVINDDASTGIYIEEYGEKVGSDVTEHPSGHATLHQEAPAPFFTQRVPRTPLIGKTVTRTINVFGNNQAIPLVQRNINRYRLLVFTDSNNAQPVYVIGSDGDGIGIGPGSVPIELRGFDSFTCRAPANGILYLIEESYYVNEMGA